MVMILLDPIRKLKLWLRKCRNIRSATKGKTLSYAKKSVKRSIRNKWRSFKGMVTSSESNVIEMPTSKDVASAFDVKLPEIKEETSKEEDGSNDEIVEDFSLGTRSKPSNDGNIQLNKKIPQPFESFRDQCSCREQDSLRVLK